MGIDMKDKNLPAVRPKTFEELKKVNQYGAEYWSARDLQPLLGYTQWRRFENAISRAKTSCQQSSNDPDHHFVGAGKMIILGKGGERQVPDYHLSRFAC
jgi:DNA-damage-inducible protein D